ncbi:MAG: transglutaminase-like domain-containing protein [bacterium]
MCPLDKTQLPFIVDLMDDDTVEVRTEVLNALKVYGLNLEQDLQSVSERIDNIKSELVKPILLENRREWLKLQWPNLKIITDEYLFLEKAIELIVKFQYGLTFELNIDKRMCELRDEFNVCYPFGSVLELANFLFVEKDFRGAKDDYYNPLNSNLIYTLENKRGLPITLTILYILAAKKLDFRVEGCRFPGHFLAKAFIHERYVLVDCFNRGRLIFEKELRYITLDSYEPFMEIINEKTTNKMIVSRMLTNLSKAYENLSDEANKNLFNDLGLIVI